MLAREEATDRKQPVSRKGPASQAEHRVSDGHPQVAASSREGEQNRSEVAGGQGSGPKRLGCQAFSEA